MTEEQWQTEMFELLCQVAQMALATYFVVMLIVIVGVICLIGYFLATSYPDLAKFLAIVMVLGCIAISRE